MLLTDLWGTEAQDHNTCGYIVLAGNGLDKPKHIAVRDVSKVQDAIERSAAAGYDVYFTPSRFDGWRLQENAAAIPAFWVDFDGDREQSMAVLLKWCADTGVPKPTHVVDSGRGTHCYWVLEAPVSRDRWRPVAEQFKRAMIVAEVPQDRSRTADEASILRAPGSVHRKDPNNPRTVTLLYRADHRVSFDQFAAALPQLGPQRAVPASPVDREWDTQAPLPPGDAEKIAQACRQMALIRDSQGAVPEPLWRAGLSVLQRCHHRDHYIHEWSKGDERYDPQATEEKASRTGGPFTCQSFDDANPGGCAGCSLAGKITSPINAAMPGPVAAPQAVALATDESWRLTQIGKYTVTAKGVYYQPPAVEGMPDLDPELVISTPVWVRQVRERNRLDPEQTHGASLQLCYRTLDGREENSVMKATELFDTAGLRNWMAEAGLAPAVMGQPAWQKLTMYISQCVKYVTQNVGITRYNEAMGWYTDYTEFVLGDRIITADGIRETLVNSPSSVAMKLKHKESATLSGWRGAAAAFARPGAEKHAFPVLASMSAPLYELLGVEAPAVLSLAGNGGTGKTSAMRLALSVWGEPSSLELGAGSTDVATSLHLSSLRHLPIGIDEVTQYEPKKLGALVYAVANSKSRTTGTIAGKTRKLNDWKTLAILTSNRAIMDLSQRVFLEAQRARAMELFFTGEEACTHEEGVQVAAVQTQHYGVVGPLLLQTYMQMDRAKMRDLFYKLRTGMLARFGLNKQQRFGASLLAMSHLAGTIAKQRNLIDYDVEAVIKVAADSLSGTGRDTLSTEQLAVDCISEWLTESNQHVSYWPDRGVMADPTGRGVRSPIARVLGEHRIAIHRAQLNNLLSASGVSPKGAPMLFSAPKRPEADRRIKLTPETPSVWCYVFDPEAIGFDFNPPENIGE